MQDLNKKNLRYFSPQSKFSFKEKWKKNFSKLKKLKKN